MRTTTSLPLTACILALASCGLIGCPQSHFGWVYSVGGSSSAGDILVSPQGGYYLTGAGRPSGSPVTTVEQTMVIRLSEAGTMEWYRFVGGMRGAVGAAVPDGGIVLASYSGTSASTYQLHVGKYDQAGLPMWNSAYGEVGNGAIFPSNAVATSDGGCVFAGMRYNGNESLPFSLKLDPQGGVVWEHHMAREVGFLNGTKMVSVGNAGFAVSGYGRLGEGRLLRMDSEGNPLWWKQYDGYWQGRGCAVDSTADGGFVLAGVAVEVGQHVRARDHPDGCRRERALDGRRCVEFVEVGLHGDVLHRARHAG